MPSNYKKLFCLFLFCAVLPTYLYLCALQSFLQRYQHQVIYADFHSGSTHLLTESNLRNAVPDLFRTKVSRVLYIKFRVPLVFLLQSTTYSQNLRNLDRPKTSEIPKQTVKMQSCIHINITPSTVEDLRRNKLNHRNLMNSASLWNPKSRNFHAETIIDT